MQRCPIPISGQQGCGIGIFNPVHQDIWRLAPRWGIGFFEVNGAGVVEELATIGPEHRHIERHSIFVLESSQEGVIRRVEADHQQVVAGRQDHVGGKIEGYGSLQAPGVGPSCRFKQRYIVGADIVELDVFVAHIVVVAGQIRRVIHDLVDHQRANFGAGIGGAKRAHALGNEVLGPDAGDIAAKGDILLGSAELEPVKITGQIRVRIPGEQIGLGTLGTERETGEDTRSGVELSFIEDSITPRRNHNCVRDAEFLGVVQIVAKKPPADVHSIAVGIVEFDGIDQGESAMAQNLVDQDRFHRHWRRIHDARGTPIVGAGPPTALQPPCVRRRCFIDNHQRSAGAVGDRIPVVVVREFQDHLAHRVIQFDLLTAVVQRADVLAGDIGNARVTRSEGRRISDQESRLPSGQITHTASREAEIKSIGEMNSGQIYGHRSDVLELEVLEVSAPIRASCRGSGGMVHDFGNAQIKLRQAGIAQVIGARHHAAGFVDQLQQAPSGGELPLVIASHE